MNKMKKMKNALKRGFSTYFKYGNDFYRLNSKMSNAQKEMKLVLRDRDNVKKEYLQFLRKRNKRR